jgi:hypothetical protein
MAHTEPVRGMGDNKPPALVDMLKEQLAETYGAELAKVAPLAERANAAPATIASDDDLKTWAEIGRDAAKLEKSLDEARLNEKRPIVAAVDGVFSDSVDRSKRINVAAVTKATIWNKHKAEVARKAQEAEAKRLRDEAEAARIAAEFAIDEAPQVVAAGQAAALEMRADMAAEPQSTADLTRVKTDSGVTATTAKTWKFEIVDASKIDLNAIRMFIDPKAIQTAIGKIVRTQKGATKIDGVRVYEEETAQFRG